jgi:hypothetical protein
VSTPHHRGPALATLLLLVVGLLAGSAIPAAGHASGELPHARLSADGEVVEVELTMAADDAALIGEVVGQLGDGAMDAYLGGPIERLPTEAEIRRFSASTELRRYLLEHVQVQQDGRPCAGEARPVADFLTEGAVLRFDCPEEVVEADVRITVLHDEDPAYRTYSIDGTVQYAVHSPTEPEHRWDFTVAREAGAGAIPSALWAALAAIVAAIGAILVRVTRRTPAPRPRRTAPAVGRTS